MIISRKIVHNFVDLVLSWLYSFNRHSHFRMICFVAKASIRYHSFIHSYILLLCMYMYTHTQLHKSMMCDCGKLMHTLVSSLGDVESTEPTKMLMRIAEHVDTASPELRSWFIKHTDDVVAMLEEENDKTKRTKKMQDLNTWYVVLLFSFAWPLHTGADSFFFFFLVYSLFSEGLRQRKPATGAQSSGDSVIHQEQDDPLYSEKLAIVHSLQRFLKKYGFRCINELKLEEKTLHDDPGWYEVWRCDLHLQTILSTRIPNTVDLEIFNVDKFVRTVQ